MGYPSLTHGSRYRKIIRDSDLTQEQKISALTALDAAIADVRSGKIADFRMKVRGIHSLPFGGNAGGVFPKYKKKASQSYV